MSKTDKTRPLGVKAMDAPGDIEADHDHTRGPCDLPPRPTKRLDCPFGDRSTSCFWRASRAFLRSPAGQCGCTSCSRGRRAWDRSPAKTQRLAGRRTAARALTDVSVHGVHDTLDDVGDWTTWLADDRDGFSDFFDVADTHAALRDPLVAAGVIPAGAQVVDVHDPDWCEHYFDAYGTCADPTLPNPATGAPGWPACCPDNGGWRIEVLHNDGHRQELTCATSPWSWLAAPVAGASAAVPVSG